MSIIIVGAGGIGLLVAARLAEAGEKVALLARSNAQHLAARGIELTQDGTTRTIRTVTVFENAAAPPFHPELVVLCVKGYDTDGVLPTLKTLDVPFNLTLQNGIGNEEALMAHFDPFRVLSGAITTSVELSNPGQITVTKRGGVGLAPVSPDHRIESFANRFGRAGFETRTFESYQSLKWSKALLNMLGNATAAILDMPVAEVYADDRLVAVERDAFREALRVMDKRGLKPVSLPRYPAAPLANAMRYLPAPLLFPLLRRTVAGGRGSKLPSLLLELRRGNPRSEGQFLYGAVAEEAARVGVDAPVNRTLWSTLHDIATGETSWDDFRRQPERLLHVLNRRDN